MGIQLDTLRKQSLGSSNPLQKALAQFDCSLADRGFAANDVMEPVFPAQVAQQCRRLDLQSLQYLWLLITDLSAFVGMNHPTTAVRDTHNPDSKDPTNIRAFALE